MHDELFIVATIPPPPGESDAYSATTKLQGPPLAMIAAMMDNVVDLQLAASAVEEAGRQEGESFDVDLDLTEDMNVNLNEDVDVDVDVDVDFTNEVARASLSPSHSRAQPIALMLAGVVTLVGGAIAALSFLVLGR